MARNTYDVSRDVVMARPLVRAFDLESGEEVPIGSEGSAALAVVLRRMDSEDGTQGTPRIALCTCYIAKKTSSRLAWIVPPKEGRPEVSAPTEGDFVLGSAAKRLDHRIAATMFALAAQYAERVVQKMAA